MYYKKTFFVLLSAVIFVSNIYAQNKHIPIEYKKPVFLLNTEKEKWPIFSYISSVMFNKYDERFYFTDSRGNKIFVFNRDLMFLNEIGRAGQGPVEFSFPRAVNFDSRGRIIVTDSRNRRVQILDNEYKYVSGFIIQQASSVLTSNAAFDSNGRIFMNLTDGGKLITVFDIEGNKISEFGELINKNENKLYQTLENAAEILFDDADNLYCIFRNFPVFRKQKYIK